VTITSAVAGTTVVSATSDIPVSGVTITRTTGTPANTASGGSGNASKTWIQQNFHGCTPGFWKNKGSSLWDQTKDALVQNMPAGLQFTQNTKFNAYFGLTPAQSGFADNVSMITALNTGGGGKIALARQAISALLSVAANLNYQFPQGAHDFTSLYTLIKNTYLGTSGVSVDTLEGQLDAANSLEAPGLC
jgi:hypothetical protein